jgi:predicted nucleotidyltransferase
VNRSSAQRNIELLTLVAYRLEELSDQVTFVGGSVIGLLITDKAAPDVRFTVDVDCIVNVITRSNYYTLAEKLQGKGFKEMPTGDHPICRWDCGGVLIDIMPIEKSVLGFSNKWYKDALVKSINTKINNSVTVNIISAPYFLATKIEAFKDRGKQDFLLSHDLEDIIALIDGRPEIIDDVSNSANDLKQYLSLEFSGFIDNNQFTEALPGHLNYTQESEDRKRIVLKRIQEIVDLGK